MIAEDRPNHRAYAVRAAWLEPGSAPYLASLRVDQASNWSEFVEACKAFRTPSENLVWADVDGQIGWQTVGIAPIRKGWDGLLPVPGDGRYEWDGYLDPAALPSERNPPKGFFASANQDNLPVGYPHAVGYQWAEPFRFRRVTEVLETSRKMTLADSSRLQRDEVLLPARSLVPLISKLKPSDPRARRALEKLAGWDFVMGRDSIPAAIYATWEKALKLAIWERLVPPEAHEAFPVRLLPLTPMIGWLTDADARLGDRDALLLAALDRAVADLTRRLGPDVERWKYGQVAYKHVWLPHPLGDAVDASLQTRLDVGPLPRGGSAQTVNSTSDSDNQATGASFRIVADVGDWDRSVGTNTPGQSGNPASPHYRDLFAPWAEGLDFPISYGRAKVEAATEARTMLVPKPADARP